MGLATTFVLVGSNVLVSVLRKLIPSKVRIACFIVIIATFVTVVELVMQAFAYRHLVPTHDLQVAILGKVPAARSKSCLTERISASFSSDEPSWVSSSSCVSSRRRRDGPSKNSKKS